MIKEYGAVIVKQEVIGVTEFTFIEPYADLPAREAIKWAIKRLKEELLKEVNDES